MLFTSFVFSFGLNGSWLWKVKGPVLEVFSTNRGERCSSWCFGAALKDTCTISAVREFPSFDNSTPKLLVCVESATSGSLLYLFDIKTSKVVKAVQLNNKITSLAIISTKDGSCIEMYPLHHDLQCMFGVVAVGTSGGQVFLLDLNLDDETYYSKLAPYLAVTITLKNHSIPGRQENSIRHNQHLSLLLNDDSLQQGVFFYKSEDNALIHSLTVDEALYVSSIEYVKSLVALVVGFSFGGFQIWNMNKMTLEFSLFIESGLPPVVKFAFQEPENDPQNYCYLWIVHGQSVSDEQRPQRAAVASMFSVFYKRKEWLDGYGFFYQEFSTCSLCFQYSLTLDPYNPDLGHSSENIENVSRLISCYTIQQSSVCGSEQDSVENNVFEEKFFECSLSLTERDFNILDWDDIQELSLCVVVWEAWHNVADTCSHCFMLLFDINQWYQAEMPSLFRISPEKLSSFVGIFSLSEVLEETKRGVFLDAYILPNSIIKFSAKSLVDQFYFPSSLGFKIFCLTENGFMQLSFLGIQRQILSQMAIKGPSIFVNPNILYNMCVKAGLVSHCQELDDISTATKRETILSVALEYNLTHLFAACIQHWASGAYNHAGCTLRFLYNWAWEKVNQIKTTCDELLKPLFNCSELELSQSTLLVLQKYSNQLSHISHLFNLLQSKSDSITQQGQGEQKLRYEVTELIAVYLKATLWMYTCQLLPEHNEDTAYGENKVTYPVKILTDFYSRRRQELQKLNRTVSHTDILLIDGLILEIDSFLDKSTYLWQSKGCNGQYPPPSLYEALNTYLLKEVPLEKKHCMILYLLLDMAAFLSQHQSYLVKNLMEYPVIFHMNSSLVKLTQGFWLLDHQDFEEALSVLLDPVIDPSVFKSWHHLHILIAFLYQGEHQKALKYTRLRNPSLENINEAKLHLTILLANRLTAEAFFFQQQYRDQRNMNDLLSHFFLGCQQTHMLDSLLKLPLSAVEEKSLFQFLFKSNDPRSKELLLMYFLQRSRPLQAAQLNERIYPQLMNSDDLSYKNRLKARNALVKGHLLSLPEAQHHLASDILLHQHQRLNRRLEVSWSFPVSAFVSTKTLPLVSCSDFSQFIMAKIGETEPSVSQDPTPFIKSLHENLNYMVNNVPFFRDPLTSSKLKADSLSEIFYPTRVTKYPVKRSADHFEILGSPKKSRLVDMSPFKSSDLYRRNSTEHIGSEVLYLLKPSPISRKSVSAGDQTLTASMSTTQFTLKFNQFCDRPGSPVIVKDYEQEVKQENVSKQLHFLLPKARSFTSYQDQWFSTPSVWSFRNMQDRSSTPEKSSPKDLSINPRKLLHQISLTSLSSEIHSPFTTEDIIETKVVDEESEPTPSVYKTSSIEEYSTWIQTESASHEAAEPFTYKILEVEHQLNMETSKVENYSSDESGKYPKPFRHKNSHVPDQMSKQEIEDMLRSSRLITETQEKTELLLTPSEVPVQNMVYMVENPSQRTCDKQNETKIHIIPYKTPNEEQNYIWGSLESNIGSPEKVGLLNSSEMSFRESKNILEPSEITNEMPKRFRFSTTTSELAAEGWKDVVKISEIAADTSDKFQHSVMFTEVIGEERKDFVVPSDTCVDTTEKVHNSISPMGVAAQERKGIVGPSKTPVNTPMKMQFSKTHSEVIVLENKDTIGPSETSEKLQYSVMPIEEVVQEKKVIVGPSAKSFDTPKKLQPLVTSLEVGMQENKDTTGLSKTSLDILEEVLYSVAPIEVAVHQERKNIVEASETVVDTSKKVYFPVVPIEIEVLEMKDILRLPEASVNVLERVDFSVTPIHIAAQDRQNALVLSETSSDTSQEMQYSVTPTELVAEERKDTVGSSETSADTSEETQFSVIPTEIVAEERKDTVGLLDTFMDTSEEAQFSVTLTEVVADEREDTIGLSETLANTPDEVVVQEKECFANPSEASSIASSNSGDSTKLFELSLEVEPSINPTEKLCYTEVYPGVSCHDRETTTELTVTSTEKPEVEMEIGEAPINIIMNTVNMGKAEEVMMECEEETYRLFLCSSETENEQDVGDKRASLAVDKKQSMFQQEDFQEKDKLDTNSILQTSFGTEQEHIEPVIDENKNLVILSTMPVANSLKDNLEFPQLENAKSLPGRSEDPIRSNIPSQTSPKEVTTQSRDSEFSIMQHLNSSRIATWKTGIALEECDSPLNSTNTKSMNEKDAIGYSKCIFAELTVPKESEDLPTFDTSKTCTTTFTFSPPLTKFLPWQKNSLDIGSYHPFMESVQSQTQQLKDPLLSDSSTSVTSNDSDTVLESWAVVIETKMKRTKSKTSLKSRFN
ncbi:protein ELYS-like [Limulus polyphemus]|uniref:Protein ELYS-like n=1 Tax=Limulus polyphemus TaxID=6850 RepID=A0ABM1T9V7_LIMPO|nr:protein ELYS-like [Limulus polyphemus]